MNTNHARTERTSAAESNFTFTWGKVAGVTKQLDRSGYETGVSPVKDLGSQLTERILTTYKTGGVTESRGRFLQKLTDNSLKFLAEKRGMRLKAVKEESIYNQAVSALVEQIFDLLQSYAYDFNQSMGWNDLFVTCTRPGFVTEVLRYSKFREPIESVTNYRARLSTRHISLVVRGQRNAIEFMSIPVDKVIGLTRAEVAYEPFARLEGVIEGDSVKWLIDGADLTEEGLERFAMDLFSGLIDATMSAVTTAESA